MAGNRPEEEVPGPVVYQGWRHVTFLHWRYEPDVVQALLPPALTVDVVDGAAWIGLTPFLVEDFRVSGAPAVAGLSSFPETNLRTYVRDPKGGDGLWFLSLDVESLATFGAGRLGLGIPYLAARMRVEATGAGDEATGRDGPPATVLYESRRITGGSASHRISVQPGTPMGDTLSERDAQLIGRWRAYAQPGGRLVQIPVQHEPWPVHSATVIELEQSITDAAGLPPPEGEPLVHYAPGVDARFGPPRPV